MEHTKNIIHLVKLSVGSESVDSLEEWQEARRKDLPDKLPRHVTRMWPKREDEILNGGSIYWVIQGAIRCRQKIIRLDEVIGNDGIRRCGIVLDSQIIRTSQALKRPFQGWRYLNPADAPADLTQARQSEDTLPDDLSAALSDIGVR
ncbi:DUF1489 family protein [Aliiroseovarius sp. YM-037]|uniref:DUF1489 family protein n=1 Tax=Aliiroseovarius sp. YM-037 TaxID=3341728 RepID=UPI003A808DF7